jgi:hypothetical protein
MSGDFELAIRCGSNNIRVGSVIFGARPPKVRTCMCMQIYLCLRVCMSERIGVESVFFGVDSVTFQGLHLHVHT